MRVLLVNHSFSSGGAERCVRDLYHGMIQRGHEVHVWIANPSDHLPANVKGICRSWERNLLPLDMIADLTDWRHRGSIEAFKQITPEHFDVVHLHHIGGSWLSLKALSEACMRVPTVWTHHDEWAVSNGFIYDLNQRITRDEIIQFSQGINRLFHRSPYHHNFKNTRVGRWIDQYAPHPLLMIAPSRYMADQIRQCGRFTETDIKQVPNGLSMLDNPAIHISPGAAREKLGIAADRPVVLMIAANIGDVHKGIMLGKQAIDNLRDSLNPHVILLGHINPSQARQLSSISDTSFYASTNDQLACAYRAADVTLIPSLSDNFPFTALESLACQRPACAFRVGGLPEIIGDNQRGMLAEPYRVDQLTDCLGKLLQNDKMRLEMGRAGRQWVKEHCAMNNFLDQIESCYQTVVTRFNNR
jgi:glycosyltransferase involved in cell wall biosynthesis